MRLVSSSSLGRPQRRAAFARDFGGRAALAATERHRDGNQRRTAPRAIFRRIEAFTAKAVGDESLGLEIQTSVMRGQGGGGDGAGAVSAAEGDYCGLSCASSTSLITFPDRRCLVGFVPPTLAGIIEAY